MFNQVETPDLLGRSLVELGILACEERCFRCVHRQVNLVAVVEGNKDRVPDELSDVAPSLLKDQRVVAGGDDGHGILLC